MTGTKMICSTTSGMKALKEARRMHDMARARFGVATACALLLALSACAKKDAPPVGAVMPQVGAGNMTIVLARATARGPDGLPFNVARQMVEGSGIKGSGLFLSASAYKPIEDVRALSEATLRDGWVYMPLAPGRTYSLELKRKSNLLKLVTGGGSEPLQWLVEVPANSRLIYAGTLVLTAEREGGWGLDVFGERKVELTGAEGTGVADESPIASEIAKQAFPQIGEMQTVLMRPAFASLPNAPMAVGPGAPMAVGPGAQPQQTILTPFGARVPVNQPSIMDWPGTRPPLPHEQQQPQMIVLPQTGQQGPQVILVPQQQTQNVLTPPPSTQVGQVLQCTQVLVPSPQPGAPPTQMLQCAQPRPAPQKYEPIPWVVDPNANPSGF
jgi:hypothetical protein